MTGVSSTRPAVESGTFSIGGDLPVVRLGYGAMRLTGRDEAIRVLRRAVELGITFIDTAHAYGPSEELIREALHPYPDELVIATKAGLPLGRPQYLRQEAEMSLRRLGLERIDLLQLHRIDPQVPLEEQLGLFVELQREGKVRHIGLSEVSVEEIRRARTITPIATVQNRYNLANRASEDVLDYCASDEIGFIPWFPIATGELARRGGPLDGIAKETGSTPAQLALARRAGARR